MPPNMKRPAAGDGRALREFGLADQDPEDTTIPEIVDDSEAWRRRIIADAEAFMRRRPARRPRGRR